MQFKIQYKREANEKSLFQKQAVQKYQIQYKREANEKSLHAVITKVPNTVQT